MVLATVGALVLQNALTFMSFNVRYATANDGENSWALRRPMVYETVRRANPDVLGVQEALALQVDELMAELSGYSYVGVGRDDGARAGEFSAIFYRRSVITVVASGTFWLSDTPEKVGSASWGNRVVRVCTWARLKGQGGEFTVFNTHFDHESQPSRLASAALVGKRASEASGPVVVMGDLNAGEQNPAVLALKESGLVDTFRAVRPDEASVGTFNGFKASSVTGEKIDYVFAGPGWRVLDAGIDRATFDGRVASDHFAVWAVLERSGL